LTAAPALPWAVPLFTTPVWRYALVFGLYFNQGVVAGFALTAVPNHFAALGATHSEIGAHIALVGLPWIVQPLWGPVVDRCGGARMGRRRFWVVAGLLTSLVALSRLLSLDPSSAATLAAISLVLVWHSAFAALTDTATDAMIIDCVPAAQLGVTNAVTRAGFVSGIALGAALFGWVLQAHGLRLAATLLLGIGGVVALLPLLVRERAPDAVLSLRWSLASSGNGSFRALFGTLGRLLRQRRTLLLLGGCFAIDAAAATFRVPLAVALIQQGGWQAADLSRLQAAIAFGSGTAGALAIGWWADRVGALRALAVLLALCALGHVAVGALVLAPDGAGLAAFGPLALGVSTVLPALVFVAVAPVVMRASHGPAAATGFALFMAALNFGDVAGSAVAGTLAAATGLGAIGLGAGGVFATGAALAVYHWRLDRRSAGMPGPGG